MGRDKIGTGGVRSVAGQMGHLGMMETTGCLGSADMLVWVGDKRCSGPYL